MNTKQYPNFLIVFVEIALLQSVHSSMTGVLFGLLDGAYKRSIVANC